MRHRPATFMPVLTVVLFSLSLAGCGDGKPKRYPVSGQVTYNGEPLPKGEIAFSPQQPDQGQGCFGVIQNGFYRMTTFRTNDGAVPGSYNVAITAIEVEPSNPLDDIEVSLTPEANVVQDLQAAKELIPRKYHNPTTSGLTAEVKAESNRIDFSLTD